MVVFQNPRRGDVVRVRYHINIFFSEEDGGYIADIPDLAHRAASGVTPELALGEVLKAKAAWMEAARAEGKPVPPPSSVGAHTC